MYIKEPFATYLWYWRFHLLILRILVDSYIGLRLKRNIVVGYITFVTKSKWLESKQEPMNNDEEEGEKEGGGVIVILFVNY